MAKPDVQQTSGGPIIRECSNGASLRRGHYAASLPARLWIYQRERFPLLTHAPLIGAFSFCMVSYSWLGRHGNTVFLVAALVAFLTALLFFLQLRIADEFKDAEEDRLYRPYRAVPRGLVTLRELGAVGILGGLAQLGLALWLSPALLPCLLAGWIYLGLMSKEFFVGPWLKAHPLSYMWSHMFIMPLVDLYGTACDWRVVGVAPPAGLLFLLLVSYWNGCVLEIGRKIRAPQDEEVGVETYSFLWGRLRAVLAWLSVLLLTAATAVLAAGTLGYAWLEGLIFLGLLGCAALLCVLFMRQPLAGRGKWLEWFSGGWSMVVYLSLGAVPLLWHVIGR
jgi:4-hydroxybenzoate polyprenyltransferase